MSAQTSVPLLGHQLRSALCQGLPAQATAKEKMRGGKAPSPRFGKCGVVRTVFCSGDLGP